LNPPIFSPFDLRKSLLHVAVALLAIVSAAPGVKAQVPPRPIDATDLRNPIEFGASGVVQAGDDPAFAQPDFDDSGWSLADAKRRLRDYFPKNQQPIIWRRLHVQVKPTAVGLALSLEPYGIDRAFEIYVNGQKLFASGQVDPYIPYTRSSRILVRIPDDLTRTGLLIVAIRARTPLSTWARENAAFNRDILTLGSENTLRDRNLLKLIRLKAMPALLALLGLGVGLVALALLSAHPREMEYLCIFALGMVGAAQFALYTLPSLIQNIPALWDVLDLSLVGLQCVAFLLLCQALTRHRFSRWLWVYVAASVLLMFSVSVAFDFGSVPGDYKDLAMTPYYLVFAGIMPLLLFRQLRRGNREAGILIGFLIFWSVGMFLVVLLAIMYRTPILRSSAGTVAHWLEGFPIGVVNVSVIDIGSLIFWVSLTIIMVLRATSASRREALMEGELEAARELQQVIFPEEVQAIPGFVVESVYLPAQQVGGDFFQVLPTSDGGLLLIVGDVAGKGLPAAMLVSVLVGAVRTVAEYTTEPGEILVSLNERLLGRTRGGFSTAVAARIFPDGTIRVANAGHIHPYLNGHELELPGALPLGIQAGTHYETNSFHLPAWSRLTFYSDGVIEAQNHKRELFGFDRGKAISTESAAAIVEAARQFGQSDDITVVAITRVAAIATAA
jgi:sigma-B regulation protein RsbU (phosphoserine phosphatase)